MTDKPETLLNIPAADGSPGDVLLELDAAASASVVSRIDASTGGRLSTRPLELQSNDLCESQRDTREPSTRSGSFTDRMKSDAAAAAARYEARRELGRGGMGLVLQVRDNDLRRDVAMKVMRADRVNPATKAGQVALQRFVEEAQITGQLEHPNIVPIHELGADAGGRVYFTMKMVRGQPLSAILREIRRGDATTIREYPLDRLLQIFLKVCDALSFGHAHNVVHRDLKPDNIMVGRFGEVMVMDWGLARVLDRPDDAEPGVIETDSRSGLETDRKPSVLSMEGSIAGTPAYMAPEQARGEISRIDQRTDIFALGAILYELLVLKPPYAGEGGSAILESAAEGRVIDPYRRAAMDEQVRENLKRLPGGTIPPELAAIAMHALAADINDRYPTVRALQADVENFMAGRPVSVRRDPVTVRVAKWVRRHPTLSMSSAAAAVVLLVSVASIMWIVAGARAEAIEQQQQIIAAETEAASNERKLKESALEREAALARRAEAAAAYRQGVESARRALEITNDEIRTPTYTLAETRLKEAIQRDPEYVDPVFALARLYDAFGNEQAIEHYLAAHRMSIAIGDRQEARALVYAGDFAFHRLEDRPRALSFYQRAAQLDPTDPYAVVGQAWVAVMEGEWPQAITLAETALKLDPALWEPWYLQGFVHNNEYRITDTTLNPLFDPHRAKELLRQAVARGRNVGLVHFALGNAQMETGELNEAAYSYRLADGYMPGHPPIVQNRANLLVRMQRPDLALAVSSYAIKAFPGDVMSWTTHGYVLLHSGEPAQAAEALETALAIQPRRVATLSNYGSALMALRRYDDARAALTTAVEIEPQFWRAWTLLAHLHDTTGDLELALSAAQKALELKPEAPSTLDRMAGVLAGLDRLTEAEDFASRAAAADAGYGRSTLGAIELKRGNPEAAVAHLEAALAGGGRNTSVLLNLARALQMLGRPAEALTHAQAAQQLDAELAEAWFRAGVSRIDLKQLEEALADFQHAAKLDPGHLDAWNNIAHCANQLGRPELARDASLKASEADPDHALALVNLAYAELALGNKEQALAVARRAAAMQNRTAHEYSEIAYLLWNIGSFDEARAQAEAALAIDPRAAAAWARLSAALWSLGRHQDALAASARACELDPKDTRKLLVHAAQLSDLRRYQETIAAARQILDIDPAHPGAHSLIGSARYGLGEYRLAAESYEAALRSRRDHARDWLNLGVCWILLNDTRSAIAPLQQATRLEPDFAPGWEYLGLSLHSEGRSEEAVAPLETALALNPQSPGANHSMANALHALGRTDDALPYAREAARLNPRSVNVWYRLGMVQFDLGNWADCIAAFEAGLRMRPDIGSFHFLIGFCRVELGEFEAGRTAARRALELDGTLKNAQIVIARAELGLGNVDEALANLEGALINGADARWSLTEAWWTKIAEDERFQKLAATYRK